jgi:hypothetical protein
MQKRQIDRNAAKLLTDRLAAPDTSITGMFYE